MNAAAVLPSIVAPLSSLEAAVLRAHVEQSIPDLPPGDLGPWAMATQRLAERGMLVRTKRGVVTSPEGLAFALDTVPIEVMRRASPPEEEQASPDAPRRPNTAKRTSAARSARRGRARS
jgi:hypothetical protein